ncbi:MAG: TspO/MBR family protein [Planctomycetota bacterium]|jgi:tryptophan-rich sensory protein
MCNPTAKSSEQRKAAGPASYLALLACAAAVFAAGGIGSAFMRASNRAWFDGLSKPTWQPPDWLFGPVWTILYVSMAISAWLFWLSAPRRAKAIPLTVFGIQLALNAAWTGVFFYLQRPGAAFAEIAVLWLAIGATALLFRRRSVAAAALLLPYWAWVTFAAALNLAIWQMNA